MGTPKLKDYKSVRGAHIPCKHCLGKRSLLPGHVVPTQLYVLPSLQHILPLNIY